MLVGNKIKVKNASWNFEKKIPKTFSKHIKKSVPLYEDAQDLTLQISDFFLKKKLKLL